MKVSPHLVGWSVAVVALAAAGAVGVAHASGGDGHVTVTAKACANGWDQKTTGTTSTDIADESHSIVDVEVVGTDHRVYGEIEHLNPGSHAALVVTLPPGRFQVQCTIGGGAVIPGPERTVTGPPVAGVHSYLPVVADVLTTVTYTYRDQVQKRLGTLVADTDALRAAVASGDPARAQAAWLTAHLDYERLGAAYGSFGDADAAINGTTDGLPEGAQSKDFTGFHKVELDLWGGAPAAQTLADSTQLAKDVHDLDAGFEDTITDPLDLPLRTHEILENALQRELTARTDEGSHTNLATTWANVDGTRMTLDVIAALVTRTDPTLVGQLDAGLNALARELVGYRHPDGSWTPVQALTLSQRQHLDATIDGLLEQLAEVPDLLDVPRDTEGD